MAATANNKLEEKSLTTKLILDIRTKSVERTLVPLVNQITTLVNAREKPLRTERALNALVRVGQAVNVAVDRFVKVGDAIASENPEIQPEMVAACHAARIAGGQIQKLTDVKLDEPGTVRSQAEKTAMVRAARQLLSAITRVLILADRVVIKQLIEAKDKVMASLLKIEACLHFPEFVQLFSQFGDEMVGLAHLSGDRQNDLKNERASSQMSVARAILEKSTMLLLTTAKTYLRHSDCAFAKSNRDSIIEKMKGALNSINEVAVMECKDSSHKLSSRSVTKSSTPLVGNGSPNKATSNGDSSLHSIDPNSLIINQPNTAFKALKEFEDRVEMTRVTFVNSESIKRLENQVAAVTEMTHDFTDSAYTGHEDREAILSCCDRLKHQLVLITRIGFGSCQMLDADESLERAINKTREASKNLKKQLIKTCMNQASEVFKANEDHELIGLLRSLCQSGQSSKVDQLAEKFESHSEQLREVCKLLRHIASTEFLQTWSEHMDYMVKQHTPEVIQASKTLALYPSSKMATENFEVFGMAWVGLINDLSVLVKDINDSCVPGKFNKQVYLSLPRPGRHGANTRGLKPANLNSEEQARIAKVGLEMKLITSEVDAEAEKWLEPDNEIVRRAKNMSCMAFSIYLFTRGEGPLNNTQDLFAQADYFAEEGAKLFRAAREFSKQVPSGSHKTELCAILELVPSLCQQLNFTIKSQTVGKMATFNKVDQVIQETKNLMNSIGKLVTACYVCATKFSIAYRGQLVGQWQAGCNSSPPPDSSFDKPPIKSRESRSGLAGTTVFSKSKLYNNHHHQQQQLQQYQHPINGSSQSGTFPLAIDSETFRRSLSLTNRPSSNHYDRL